MKHGQNKAVYKDTCFPSKAKHYYKLVYMNIQNLSLYIYIGDSPSENQLYPNKGKLLFMYMNIRHLGLHFYLMSLSSLFAFQKPVKSILKLFYDTQ